mmetsp:Transcript_25099/g.31458  ORF Transcript_25099/g.31458 Transcript_25099/m.31458 type:complete len:82 (+) Transcript_25099:357-602(+)
MTNECQVSPAKQADVGLKGSGLILRITAASRFCDGLLNHVLHQCSVMLGGEWVCGLSMRDGLFMVCAFICLRNGLCLSSVP